MFDLILGTMGRKLLVGRCSSMQLVLSENGTGSVLRFILSLRNLEKSSSNGSKGNCKYWIASLLTLHVDEYFRAGGLGGESNSYGIESDNGLLFGVGAMREYSTIVLYVFNANFFLVNEREGNRPMPCSDLCRIAEGKNNSNDYYAVLRVRSFFSKRVRGQKPFGVRGIVRGIRINTSYCTLLLSLNSFFVAPRVLESIVLVLHGQSGAVKICKHKCSPIILR
jgi:hypothetical protein